MRLLHFVDRKFKSNGETEHKLDKNCDLCYCIWFNQFQTVFMLKRQLYCVAFRKHESHAAPCQSKCETPVLNKVNAYDLPRYTLCLIKPIPFPLKENFSKLFPQPFLLQTRVVMFGCSNQLVQLNGNIDHVTFVGS